VMHYQLYLQPYQPYQIYQPCCFSFGIPIWPTTPRRLLPQPATRPNRIGRR
jgi:hypothetical protein